MNSYTVILMNGREIDIEADEVRFVEIGGVSAEIYFICYNDTEEERCVASFLMSNISGWMEDKSWK